MKLFTSGTAQVEVLDAIPTNGLTVADIHGHLLPGHEDHLLPHVQDTPGEQGHCRAWCSASPLAKAWGWGRTWLVNG